MRWLKSSLPFLASALFYFASDVHGMFSPAHHDLLISSRTLSDTP